MARTQSVKQSKHQLRKVASNATQTPPTRPAAVQHPLKNVDPPPILSPPSDVVYQSFSELYYNEASSLTSSSAETLVTACPSPTPMDWDRETLYDPTSFRDSFYGSPHEDDLPIPGKDFIFGTPPMDDSPDPSQQLPSAFGWKTSQFDLSPVPEEDMTVIVLSNEFAEKLTVESPVIEMEVDVDMSSPVITPPSEKIQTRPLSLSSHQSCIRTSRLRSRPPYCDASKSLSKRRLSVAHSASQNQLISNIKEPSRAQPPAKMAIVSI